MGRMFNIGDRVSPKPEYVGSGDIFEIVGIKECDNILPKYDLKQLTGSGRELTKMQLQDWTESQLKVLPTPEQPVPVNLQVDYEPYKPLYIGGIDLCEKENKNMKILNLYEDRAFEKINKKYKEIIAKLKEQDPIQKMIQETENHINVMLDRTEQNYIELKLDGFLMPRTIEEIEKFKKEELEEKDKLDSLLTEVRARLEICDDDEFSKVSVLQAYKILDEEGKLTEYKVDKKGKK